MGAVVQKWVQQPGAHDDEEEGVPLVDVHDEDHEMDDVDVVDERVPLRVHRHDMKPTERKNITMN